MMAAAALVVSAGRVSGQQATALPRPSRLPNVVLVVVDALRADHLGCYGYDRPTSPNVDQLASQGVLFSNCLSPASWTLPSIMSMMTGLYPSAHGIWHTRMVLPDKATTLPEELADRGYRCVGVVSSPMVDGGFGFARGFSVYDDYSFLFTLEALTIAGPAYKNQTSQVSEIPTGPDILQRAKSLVDRCGTGGRPCFLFVHLFEPHDSYVPPGSYNIFSESSYAGPMDGRGVFAMKQEPPAPRDIRHLVDLYDGEILFADEIVGQLIDHIDRTWDPANTIVFLTSDHGEAFGEHGCLQHGNNAYIEETHVPLVVRWRGVLPEGRAVAQPVSTLDIAATLKQLLNLKGPRLAQGRSLWPQLLDAGASAANRTVLSERANGIDSAGHHLAVTDGRKRLHARFREGPSWKDTKWELYLLAEDPGEQTNLASDRADLDPELRRALLDIRQESCQIRQLLAEPHDGRPPPWGEQTEKRIRGMGYFR